MEQVWNIVEQRSKGRKPVIPGFGHDALQFQEAIARSVF